MLLSDPDKPAVLSANGMQLQLMQAFSVSACLRVFNAKMGICDGHPLGRERPRAGVINGEYDRRKASDEAVE